MSDNSIIGRLLAIDGKRFKIVELNSVEIMGGRNWYANLNAVPEDFPDVCIAYLPMFGVELTADPYKSPELIFEEITTLLSGKLEPIKTGRGCRGAMCDGCKYREEREALPADRGDEGKE